MKRLASVSMVFSLAISALAGSKTVNDRVTQYGAAVDKRLAPFFAAADIPYPPAKVTLTDRSVG